MKKLASIALLICLGACTKSAQQSGTTVQHGSLSANTTAAAQGQPITLSIQDSSNASSVQWTATPSANAQVTADGFHAQVQFSQKGSYVVKAAYNWTTTNGAPINTVDSVTITVSDSVYTTPADSLLDSSAAFPDQLNVTASVSDTSHLLMVTMQTSNYYGCSPTFLYQATTTVAGAISIDVKGVQVYAVTPTCQTYGQASTLFQLTPTAPANGTYPLSITFEGTTYTGSVTVSSSGYTFNWTYTSGVVISPLQYSY